MADVKRLRRRNRSQPGKETLSNYLSVTAGKPEPHSLVCGCQVNADQSLCVSLPGKVEKMEWSRIEEKWLEMTGKLQASAHGAKQPGANAEGLGGETSPPNEDQGPVQDELNTSMIA